MGCACGKNRAASRSTPLGAPAGAVYVYDYTDDKTGLTTTFGTALEGKREVRKNGGGTLRRRVQTVAA